MSKQDAQRKAIQQAKEKLAGVDLPSRCQRLGLPAPQQGRVDFRAFGIDFSLDSHFELTERSSATPAKLGDHILALHYLLCDFTIEPTGQWITFRDLPGGQFYWQPFLSRSIHPLMACIGNELERLKKNLDRFIWEPFDAGDCAAKIHAVGLIDVVLVYHLGDEEFGPAAEILFDAAIKRIYNTEDVAFLASRICLGLL